MASHQATVERDDNEDGFEPHQCQQPPSDPNPSPASAAYDNVPQPVSTPRSVQDPAIEERQDMGALEIANQTLRPARREFYATGSWIHVPAERYRSCSRCKGTGMVIDEESPQPTPNAPRPGGLTIPPPPSTAGALTPQAGQTTPPPSSGEGVQPQLGRPILPLPSSAGAFHPPPSQPIPPPPSSAGGLSPTPIRTTPPPPSSGEGLQPQLDRPVPPPASSAGALHLQPDRPIPPPPSSGERFRPKGSRTFRPKDREGIQAELFEHWKEQQRTREMMAKQKASDSVPEQPRTGMSEAVMVSNIMLSRQRQNEAAYESPFSPIIRPSDDRTGTPSPSIHSEITNHNSEEASLDASEILSDAQMPTEQQSENHDAADSAPSPLAPPGRGCDDVFDAEHGAEDLSHGEPRPQKGFLGPGGICLDSPAPSLPVKRKKGGPDERKSGSPSAVTAKRPRV